MPAATSPKYDDKIDNIILGDAFTLQKNVWQIPAGLTVNKAWFTLKPAEDTDVTDALKLIQKIITTVASADGQITQPGIDSEGSRVATVTFYVLPPDTFNLNPDFEYPWDIQVRLSSSADAIYTPYKGFYKGIRGVTNKTA